MDLLKSVDENDREVGNYLCLLWSSNVIKLQCSRKKLKITVTEVPLGGSPKKQNSITSNILPEQRTQSFPMRSNANTIKKKTTLKQENGTLKKKIAEMSQQIVELTNRNDTLHKYIDKTEGKLLAMKKNTSEIDSVSILLDEKFEELRVNLKTGFLKEDTFRKMLMEQLLVVDGMVDIGNGRIMDFETYLEAAQAVDLRKRANLIMDSIWTPDEKYHLTLIDDPPDGRRTVTKEEKLFIMTLMMEMQRYKTLPAEDKIDPTKLNWWISTKLKRDRNTIKQIKSLKNLGKLAERIKTSEVKTPVMEKRHEKKEKKQNSDSDSERKT